MKIKLKKKTKQEKIPLPRPEPESYDFTADHKEILRLRKKVTELENNMAESPEKYVWTDASYQKIVKQRDLYYGWLMDAYDHLPKEVQDQIIPF